MQSLGHLFEGARHGERAAVDALFAACYEDFHQIARARLRKSTPLTLLETTALVNESYLRLLHTGKLAVSDRTHFLAYAACVMRSIVVDMVRERLAQRRGGGERDSTLNTEVDTLPAAEQEILQVNEALDALGRIEPRLVEVVELRYFSGLTEAEIALSLGVSERTVRRMWEKAKVMLGALLRES